MYVFATHGIFSGCAKSILKEFPNLEKVTGNSYIDIKILIFQYLKTFQIVVTNSLPQKDNVEYFGSKIEVVDISGMVSEYIRRSHYNESVSVLSHNYHPGLRDMYRQQRQQYQPSVSKSEVELYIKYIVQILIIQYLVIRRRP